MAQILRPQFRINTLQQKSLFRELFRRIVSFMRRIAGIKRTFAPKAPRKRFHLDHRAIPETASFPKGRRLISLRRSRLCNWRARLASGAGCKNDRRSPCESLPAVSHKRILGASTPSAHDRRHSPGQPGYAPWINSLQHMKYVQRGCLASTSGLGTPPTSASAIGLAPGPGQNAGVILLLELAVDIHREQVGVLRAGIVVLRSIRALKPLGAFTFHTHSRLFR